ncbi:MAG TPA: TldD/PmbA family protein [Actinomycetota bacterium]|nr:TldD/PmbA family protein [Actinomycetota bacterium]
MSLEELAQKLVERAGTGEAVEAFLTHGREFTVRAYDGDVESLSSAEPRGAGLRVITEGRAGFAYSTDLTEAGLDRLVDDARTNARHATPDEAVALPEPWAQKPDDVPGLVDDAQTSVTPDEKVRFAVELERATRGADERVRTVEDAVYADSEIEIAIANSNGIAGSYRSTDAWCYSVAIATEGDDTEVGFDFDLARGLNGLDAAATARRAADRAVSVLGARKIPSGRMPVILDPYTSGQFLGVIAGVLTGEAVQKGRSLFAGRLGESVASPELTLWDDGRIAGAPGSAPWDDEGVPRGRTNIIEGGVLESFLYDVISARRDGRRSTGNATRAGFKSAPGPSPSNLAFDPTGQTRAEVMKMGGRAFLVQDFHGVHSGANPISGDFSVGATGLLLEDGEPVRSVKEVTIAAPMLEILAGIRAVADDRRWLPFGGSLGGATTLVEEMTVAGE